MFNATAVVVRDPFHPGRHRDVRMLAAPGPIRACVPALEAPHIVLRNGRALLRAQWDEPVARGDLITVVVLPQSGGGGRKNPLAAILTIAVAIYAPGIAASVYSAAGGTYVAANAGLVIAGLSAAVQIGGAMLINALLPPPRPSGPNMGAAANYAAASPTYSLAAQGNSARIGGAIPVGYGRSIAYPDFAAQPYAEFSGNEQYLYQLMCVGVGEYDIEAIRIEDTSIFEFDEIESEIVRPGETLDLFPAAVNNSIEVAGQELLTNAAIGAFVANPATTQATRLAVDLVCPRGLYYANDAGGLNSRAVTVRIEARLINDAGAAIGGWITLGTETISGATVTPQRRTYFYGVAAGRYEVKATRTDTKDTSSRAGHEVVWAGLRAYLVSGRTFGNVTLIALKMRATNNLSSAASRKINVIATRKLPRWTGSAWSPDEATRSPAWAAADCCRAIGLPDARIALDELADLATTCTGRGDYFDGRFDQTVPFWDALTKICQAMRVKPYMQGGIVRFCRDAQVTVPVAMFSPRNMIRGSFSLEFVTPSEDTADAVEVSYFDGTAWKPRTVTGAMPGSEKLKPAKVELFGVTDRAQAYREALYMAAANRYRRTVIRFATEMEGFVPSYGDLITLSHDMPAWGQSGEIISWDPGTRTATTSEPLTWAPTGAHYFALRRRDGSVDGPYTVTQGAAPDEVVFASAPGETPYIGGDAERTFYTFGAGETWAQKARVIRITPRGMTQVEIEAINEDPSVHTADSGAVAPAVVSSQLPAIPTVPNVAGLIVRSSPLSADTMLLTWQPAPGADRYVIEQSADGELWTRVGETTTTNYTVNALYGPATIVRVAAVGLTRGGWIQISYASGADYMWNANPATAMWSSDSATMWRF